jgi:predicted PurR-regulated permease PerM
MTQPSRANADVTHVTLSVLFVLLLAGATFWVLSPFITSILWAIIVSVAVWRLLLRLDEALGGRRKLAVGIVCASILLLAFLPVILALATIVKSAADITAEIRSFETVVLPSPPAWLAQVPLVGARVSQEWNAFALADANGRAAVVAPHAQAALTWFASQAGSIGRILLQFVLTTLIAALALVRGEAVRDGILRFVERLGGPQGREAAQLAAKTIRGVVLGVVGTALVQALIGGTGLYLSGVPAAPLLTAVTLFLCMAQLGPMPVLVPAALWLFWSGRTGSGITLLTIAIAAGTLDNVIRPLLIRRGADAPLVLIFAGVLGGLLAFGVIGLFVGPVVLTVAHALLTKWMWAEPTPPPHGNLT